MAGFNKYKAKRIEYDGRSFHSKGEKDCYQLLKLMEKGGQIDSLECQISIRLGPRNRRWILDFRYFDHRINEVVWADFKGFETDRWAHLVDLWILEGPAILRVYKKQKLKITCVEEIIPRKEAQADERDQTPILKDLERQTQRRNRFKFER